MRRGRIVAAGAVAAALASVGSPAAEDPATALHASYAQLAPELEHSPFGAPVHLVSSEQGRRLEGDVHALLEQPFERVRAALGAARNWCDILVLHPNVTSCRLGDAADPHPSVIVDIGRQHASVELAYQVVASRQDYLDVRLGADAGPLGTRDYRIALEAIPLDAAHTYMRLVFSQAYGVQAQIAMSAYLRTLGRGKVGFSTVGRDANGRPVYVDGLRGALERNAMRYYVCVAAYLESLAAPPADRVETRLRRWYAYAQRYSPQLHEDPEYLALKRRLAAS